MSDDMANERRRFLRSGTAGLVGAMVAVRSEAQTLTPPTALDGRVNPNGRFTGKVVLITGGTNAGGVFRCMRAEIPIMLQQGGGVIINNASVSAHTAFHGMSGYAASKHAVLGLTKVAAAELGDKNIRVVSISPLAVDTPMLRGSLQHFKVPPEQAASANPFRRINTTDEIARAVLFLASDDASSLGGMDLDVTGGWLTR